MRDCRVGASHRPGGAQSCTQDCRTKRGKQGERFSPARRIAGLGVASRDRGSILHAGLQDWACMGAGSSAACRTNPWMQDWPEAQGSLAWKAAILHTHGRSLPEPGIWPAGRICHLASGLQIFCSLLSWRAQSCQSTCCFWLQGSLKDHARRIH